MQLDTEMGMDSNRSDVRYSQPMESYIVGVIAYTVYLLATLITSHYFFYLFSIQKHSQWSLKKKNNFEV